MPRIELIRITTGSPKMREDLADYLERSRQLDHIIEDCRKCALDRMPAANGKPPRFRADVLTRMILGKFLSERKTIGEAITTAFSFWEGRKQAKLANYIGVATVAVVSEPLTQRIAELYESKVYKLTVQEITNMLRGATVERKIEVPNRHSYFGPSAA